MIELVVAVALLSLLATMAAPNMGQFLASRRVEDVARRLGEDLALARNEAVKRNTSVLVCADATVTGSTCAATPLAADWAKGWRICYSSATSGSCDAGVASDPNPVRTRSAVDSAVSLSGPASRLQFNSSGSMTSTGAASFAVSPAGRTSPRWSVNGAASGAISVRKTG